VPDPPPRRRRWTSGTIVSAVAAGVVAAIATIVLLDGPLRDWRRDRLRPAWIAAITGVDPAGRREAWSAIEDDLADETPLGGRLLADLDAALGGVEPPPSDAVADAARTLDRHGLWRWEARPYLAIARSIEALAADPVDRVAIDRLRDRPELRSLPVRPETAAAIWARSDDSTRLELLPSLARLAAPIRRELLEGLARPDDPITARRLEGLLAASDVDVSTAAGLDVAWDLASDPERPRAMRRLALTRLARAGRLAEIPDTVRASIERGPIATAEGTVVPTVLLEEATAAAEGPAGSPDSPTSWLASLDPAKRAAGVLLLAVRGERAEATLHHLAALRRDPDERRVATLAAAALALDDSARLPASVSNRREFLHRIAHRGSGLDPDVLTLRLAAGEEYAVDDLLERGVAAESPALAEALEIALLERFCPEFAALDLADRDLALATWWRMRSEPGFGFDPDTRRWRRAIPE
jgi:hypothetical protein